MIPIPVKEFVKQTVKANPTKDAASLTTACHEMLQLKRSGKTCINSGTTPILAAGSAITGITMCFTCMTGDADDSEDCEIE